MLNDSSFLINFPPRETLPDRLRAKAATLDITPEMLIMRFISQGMEGEPVTENPDIVVTDMDSLFVSMGLLKPKE